VLTLWANLDRACISVDGANICGYFDERNDIIRWLSCFGRLRGAGERALWIPEKPRCCSSRPEYWDGLNGSWAMAVMSIRTRQRRISGQRFTKGGHGHLMPQSPQNSLTPQKNDALSIIRLLTVQSLLPIESGWADARVNRTTPHPKRSTTVYLHQWRSEEPAKNIKIKIHNLSVLSEFLTGAGLRLSFTWC
jgi:hypothetical protein